VNIDFVTARKGIFEDVLQETLLATYKCDARRRTASVHFIHTENEQRVSLGRAGSFQIPQNAAEPWLIPRSQDQQGLVRVLQMMPFRLKHYGYQVSTGPLVWNRHKSQLADSADIRALPLIWAECVTPDGRFIFRSEKKNHKPFVVPRPGDDWLICREPCVLVQRTTAKEQHRRIIAAELPRSFVSQRGGVVIENHLNMVRTVNGAVAVPPSVLTALLNSRIVDRAFRCLSGSVAVSAYELEALPLPDPGSLWELESALRQGADREEIEAVCEKLYGQPEKP